MDLDECVIDVEEDEPVPTDDSQQWGLPVQIHYEPESHRVEMAHVTEGEGTQERPPQDDGDFVVKAPSEPPNLIGGSRLRPDREFLLTR